MRDLCPALQNKTYFNYSLQKLRSHAAQWFSKRRQESFSHTFSHGIWSTQSADNTLSHDTQK